MNWWEDQRTWTLNTFWRRWHFVMHNNCFPVCFFEGGDLKVSLSWSLKGVNIGMTLLLQVEIKKVWSVNCLLCWKTMWRRCPLGWGIELCGSSSGLGGLKSLLNTEGILTLLETEILAKSEPFSIQQTLWFKPYGSCCSFIPERLGGLWALTSLQMWFWPSWRAGCCPQLLHQWMKLEVPWLIRAPTHFPPVG